MIGRIQSELDWIRPNSNVVRVTSYLTDMDDYALYNEIYREYFTQEPLPVRASVAVRELARGAVIEMIMIAVR